jgi:tetratricopeptide (TPR) repeat protein
VCFEQALAALEHLPEGREKIEQAIDIRFALRNSHTPIGEFGRVFDILREAEALAEGLDDQRRMAWVYTYRTQNSWTMGNPDHAVESGRRAITIATELGDFPLQVATNFFSGLAYNALGDYLRAKDSFRNIVKSLKGDLMYEHLGLSALPSVLSRAWLAWSLAECGEFAEGNAQAEEAVQTAETVNQPYSLSAAYLGIGLVFLYKGDFHMAIPAFERSLAITQEANIPGRLPWIASYLGYAHALSGRIEEGLPLFQQAIEQADCMRMMVDHSHRISCLGEAHLLAGRVDESLSLGERALDLSREHKERGHEAWALRLLGEIHSHPDSLDALKAEENYRASLTLAEELGMRPLQAHCRKGFGALYGRTGRGEKGREELTAAMDMYREMEMTFWLEKAEEALAGRS